MVGNTRAVIVAVAGLAGVACATAPAQPASSTQTAAAAVAAKAPDREEIRFMKHRLMVHRDTAGKIVKAEAFDPDDKPVPAIIVPIGDVKVCPPKIPPEMGGGAAPACEKFSFLPEGISFKTGTGTLCWYTKNGQLVYYKC